MRASGVEIRPLASRADYDACVALQELTWGQGFNERVPPAILRLSQRLGGIADGAFDAGGTLLGFVFGMTGVRNGRVVHWSDMLAVHPAARDKGIGQALKLHQRASLLARNIDLVQWTFDPLEARNAWLNFTRLGCIAREYIRDFYEASDSPLHQGLPTDRLVVSWELDSERVRVRLNGGRTRPSETAPLVNPRDEDQLPALTPHDVEAAVVRVAIPASIQTLKCDAPEVAARWSASLRASMEKYMTRGYVVRDVVRDGDGPAYLLERSE